MDPLFRIRSYLLCLKPSVSSITWVRIRSYISSRRQTIFSKRMALLEPSIQVKVRQLLLYLIRTNVLIMYHSTHRSKDPAEAFKAIFAAGRKARIFFSFTIAFKSLCQSPLVYRSGTKALCLPISLVRL